MQLQAMLNMDSADKNLARPRMVTEQFLGACICQKINKLTDKEQQHVRKMSHFLMLGPEEQSQYVFFYFNILSSNLKMETVGNMFSQGKMSVNKSGILLTKKTNVMVFPISVTGFLLVCQPQLLFSSFIFIHTFIQKLYLNSRPVTTLCVQSLVQPFFFVHVTHSFSLIWPQVLLFFHTLSDFD